MLLLVGQVSKWQRAQWTDIWLTTWGLSFKSAVYQTPLSILTFKSNLSLLVQLWVRYWELWSSRFLVFLLETIMWRWGQDRELKPCEEVWMKQKQKWSLETCRNVCWRLSVLLLSAALKWCFYCNFYCSDTLNWFHCLIYTSSSCFNWKLWLPVSLQWITAFL